MTKKRHQVKSSWYYYFWGVATVAVVLGQIYIGSGYHSMSNSVNKLLQNGTTYNK
ncbi:hypothetical protein W1230910_046 [Cyanophage S-RIM14]|uniref:Uncharacterized protein n=1 Tax=Cyanophage S-RIM14 TaxID=1278423 RepID=A0A1D7SMY9_9CAUD|nr:hypothetical protein W1230910_046 [Cyanophage S-RIM14]